MSDVVSQIGTALVSQVAGASVVAQVSGTVTINNGASVTIQQGASVSAVVSGTVTLGAAVSLSSIVPVTTAASVSVSGLPVWLNPTQTVVVAPGLSVSAVVSGTVTANGTVNANIVSVSTIVTILGTQIVSVVPGLSVSAVVSGTVTAVLPGSTTGSSGMSGVLVWLWASQTVLISTQVSGTVTINNGASVTIQQGASVSAVVSGTVTVNGTVAVVSITALSTVVTLLGTVVVSQVGYLFTTTGVTTGTAQAVWIMNPTTVTVTVTPTALTTAPPSISQTGGAVWVAGGQSTTAFPVFVSQINPPAGGGGSVTTAAPSVSATGQIVYIVGGQSTTALPVWVSQIGGIPTNVSGTVSLLNVVEVTTQASASVSGVPVWIAPSQTVGHLNYVPFLLMVTVTSSIIPPTTLIFTVWTGPTVVGTGTTQYVVPANRALRILNMQVVCASSAVIQVNRYAMLVSTGTPTMTSTVGIELALAAPLTVTTAYQIQACADIDSGRTVAIGVDVGNTRHVVVAIVLTGYLF